LERVGVEELQDEEHLRSDQSRCERILDHGGESSPDAAGHGGDVLAERLDVIHIDSSMVSVSPDVDRRGINQAILEKILITEDGIQGSVLAQPFADLASEEFVTELEQAALELRGAKTANRRRLSSAGGWNETTMAPPAGFEPLNSRS
jgi:hypothetical protein